MVRGGRALLTRRDPPISFVHIQITILSTREFEAGLPQGPRKKRKAGGSLSFGRVETGRTHFLTGRGRGWGALGAPVFRRASSRGRWAAMKTTCRAIRTSSTEGSVPAAS